MISLAALAGLFILSGLSVAGFAFYGTRSANAKPSRGGSRVFYAGLAIVSVGVGLVVPALLIHDNNASASRNAVGVGEITAAQAKGRVIFATTCATCHTLRASNATGHVGPNLDVMHPNAALVENAIKLGRANGNGNMPALLLNGADAKNVAAYIAAVAGH